MKFYESADRKLSSSATISRIKKNQSLAEKLAEELSGERGVTEELYQNDPLEWILKSEKIQEDIRSKLAEEIQK